MLLRYYCIIFMLLIVLVAGGWAILDMKNKPVGVALRKWGYDIASELASKCMADKIMYCTILVDDPLNFKETKDIQVLKEMGITLSPIWKAQIFFLDDIDNWTRAWERFEHQTLPEISIVMFLEGSDLFCQKEGLYQMFESYFGRRLTCNVLPPTWVLLGKSPNDLKHIAGEIHRSILDCTSPVQFIYKNNIQKQMGIEMAQNMQDINSIEASLLKAQKNGSVVCQQVMGNEFSYLFDDDRKISLRYYILVKVQNYRVEIFYHYNGIVNYAKKAYKTDAPNDLDAIITKANVSEEFYKTNPLSLHAFYEHVSKKHGSKAVIQLLHSVNDVLYKMSQVMVMGIGLSSFQKGKCTYAQIFGVDLQPTTSLDHVILLECNKGPEMKSMDERDHKIKHSVLTDFYSTLIHGKKDSVDMVQIYDSRHNDITSISCKN